MARNAPNASEQAGRKLVKLARMESGKLPEYRGTRRGDAKHDLAAVSAVGGTLEQPFGHAAIDQLDGAVVAKPQPLSRVGDGGCFSFRDGSDLQQQLVLLRVKARVVRGLFAEV